MSDAAAQYLAQNREQHIAQLVDFLRIPSISALSAHKPDIRNAAGWLAKALTEAGLENAAILETSGNPVVYADHLHAPGKPTVLIYGHYDVQPVDPLHLWVTAPFEPSVREGRIYARGSSDDKGQTYMHVKALEALIRTGELAVNVKLCIEGEEEIGSVHLVPFVEQNAELLAADVLVISDSSIFSADQPAICYGLRGLCALQIDVVTANSDLHSGTYGGAVPNANHALVELLATLHAKDGVVQVAGFYDDVKPLSAEERAEYAALPHDDEAYRQALALPALRGEAGYSTLERSSARPTLEINGMYGGFQGEGTKTVIPAQAHAKITCRLVDNQDPERVLDLIEDHLRRNCPEGAAISLTRIDKGRPFLTSLESPAIQTAAAAYEAGWGVKPLFTRMGGSIPIVEPLARILQVPVVLMGFGLDDDYLHAPNEHFALANYDRGLATLIHFYTHLQAVR